MLIGSTPTKTSMVRAETTPWHILRTRYRMEGAVTEVLARKEVTCFLPRVPVARSGRRRQDPIPTPLFPGYVFLKPPYDFEKIQFVPGGLKLLSWNGMPASIPEKVLDGIKAFLAFGHPLERNNELQFGITVEVVHGPLIGIRGELVKFRGTDRLVINTEILGQSVSVEINRNWIRKLD
jgi:transcription antitermination factor NusG